MISKKKKVLNNEVRPQFQSLAGGTSKEVLSFLSLAITLKTETKLSWKDSDKDQPPFLSRAISLQGCFVDLKRVSNSQRCDGHKKIALSWLVSDSWESKEDYPFCFLNSASW